MPLRARAQSSDDSRRQCRLEIRALGKHDSAEVLIFGDIGDTWDSESVTAARFVRDLQNVEAKTLNVRINSIGGSVKDGVAISTHCNVIRRWSTRTSMGLHCRSPV
jgi:ATP-dependent protease ClpP protease subunit